ncbi:MAG: DotU family type IV/VI secretion system protein [Chlorobi bacterium]|jgi:type IV/VI secretion system ImpK/VasF family protein|nr:DotU family type IV/VI secretion system protein [Chlorobiota bacterium]
MLGRFGQSLLVRWFREVFLIVRDIASDETSATLPPEHIQRRLVEHIAEYDRRATRIGGSFLDAYGDVRYAMVAVADELLITTPWTHQLWWQQNLLEVAVVGTYIAGEEFFNRAVRIIGERQNAHAVEVAKVYLLSLLLGFRGKWRGSQTDTPIEQLTAQLYEVVCNRPYMPGVVTVHMAGTSDLRLFSGGDIEYFAPSYRRYVMLAASIVATVLASMVVWFILTAPLRRAADEIEESPAIVFGQVQRTPPRTHPELALTITASASGPAILRLYDATRWEVIADTAIVLAGEARIALPPRRTLALICEAAGCFPVLDTLRSDDTSLIRRTIVLERLATLVGRPIVLDRVSFEAGSADLTMHSEPWLEALSRALGSDTSLAITVYGYTDSRGNTESNLRLSTMRAERVVTYLMQHGTPLERLRAIGMGSRNPRAPNTTDEGRAANRRVEVVLSRR